MSSSGQVLYLSVVVKLNGSGIERISYLWGSNLRMCYWKPSRNEVSIRFGGHHCIAMVLPTYTRSNHRETYHQDLPEYQRDLAK